MEHGIRNNGIPVFRYPVYRIPILMYFKELLMEKEYDIGGKKVKGIVIDMPNAPLVLAKTGKGYVMCGYLNMETAEKLGDIAAIVRGVNSVDDLLEAKIVVVSSKARELGVKEGMTGIEALERM